MNSIAVSYYDKNRLNFTNELKNLNKCNIVYVSQDIRTNNKITKTIFICIQNWDKISIPLRWININPKIQVKTIAGRIM